MPVIQAVVAALLCAVMSFPVRAATYDYPYPTAENKKGLGLGADMEEDGLELNICHASINFPISLFIASKSERNSGSSYSYRYKGKTYWFRKANIHAWDRTLKKLKQNNVIVSGILLMQKRSDLKNLIYPAARKKKAAFYAWNMDGGANQRQIEAAISYLARRYSSGKNGRVVGWIVGNEIDSATQWNAAGDISFSEYMDLYARMFETSSRIVRGVYSNARVYVPLDHFWNMIYSNNYTAKDCLDTFARRMQADGYSWNLAYHAYNGDLMQPSITDPQYFDTTDQPDTPIITMKNLRVLTNYIRTNYGDNIRVTLDEQGYSSTWKGQNVSAQQSEAVALSYYLAMADPMVDSFIYYSQVDQNELTKDGASFGIWKVSKREKATVKKPSWTVFKYMDTDLNDPVLNQARTVSEQMTGVKASATRAIQIRPLSPGGKYRTAVGLKKGWKACGAVSSLKRKGGGFVLRRDSSRNENVYWGIQKNARLDASAHPHLMLTLRNGRLTNGETRLQVRVFSGNQNVIEASALVRSKAVQRFQFDLSQWSGISSITRIEILIKRESGRWRGKSGAVLEKIGFR